MNSYGPSAGGPKWFHGPKALLDWALVTDESRGEPKWTTVVLRVLLLLVLFAGVVAGIIKLAFWR